MTVKELIARLQTLEHEGLGDLQVACNDSEEGLVQVSAAFVVNSEYPCYIEFFDKDKGTFGNMQVSSYLEII